MDASNTTTGSDKLGPLDESEVFVVPTVGGSLEGTVSEQESLNVSVVIPTRNRPEAVVRAVRSALDQTLAPIEIVVVIDGPDSATVQALNGVDDARIRVFELAENGGASRARNIGVSSSEGDWVAFLDDDDEWLPTKLAAQALASAAQPVLNDLVLATGVEWKGDSSSDWWPLRSPTSTERISDYLFVRRHPGEGLLATPTIMLPRDLAVACPFPEHLHVHEDYDWFIELEKAGARFVVVLEPLVVVNAPSVRTSVSTNAQWTTSLSWVLSRKGDMSKRAFSDFCLTIVARLARPTGGLWAEAAIFCIASTGRLSGYSLTRFLAICLLPAEARRRIADRASGPIRHARRASRR